MLREGEIRIPSGCAIAAIIDRKGGMINGSEIIKSISLMHDRSNGLGGGFAAYGIYPEHRDEYAFHIFFENAQAHQACEEFLFRHFNIDVAERIPTKKVESIGGGAGSFLGEYMAGGTIVLLGLNLKRGEKLFGTHCASGMHGGKMFVRGSFPKENLSPNIRISTLTPRDRKELEGYVRKYCRYFEADYDGIMKKPFHKLVPETSRPYANLYTAE